MKVLFYCVNSLANIPNLCAELDLMQTHLDAGDDVYVLRCGGQLSYCNVNPRHWRSKCYLCTQSLDRGLNALRPGKLHHQLPVVMDFTDVFGCSWPDFSVLPTQFEDMTALLAYRLDGLDLGAAVVSSVVSKTKEHKLDTVRYQAEIYNSLKSAYLVAKAADRILNQLQPDRVYFFNGRLAECRPFLQTCRAMNITSYTIERAGDFGRYTLFENALAIDLEYIKSEIERIWLSPKDTEENRREIGKVWFLAKRQGILTGDKYYGSTQVDDLLPDTFNPAQRNIAVFTTSEYEFAGIKEWQNPLYADQNEAILKIAQSLQADASCADVHLWVRVHPNMSNRQCAQLDDLRAIEAMAFPNLHVIWPESPVDSYTLMEQSDITLTFGSTLGVEAVFWGKPSILAGRALYEDLDCCYRPASHEELVALLISNVPAKSQDGAIKYGYRMMRNGRPYRYFKQTGYYEGEFQGETFRRLAGGWRGQLYHFGLRKLDKFQTRWRRKQTMTALSSLEDMPVR